MSWQLASWLLLGGSTVLLFLGLPVVFSFLVINVLGAWMILPVLSVLLAFFARKRIQRDERMVRDMDRIR